MENLDDLTVDIITCQVDTLVLDLSVVRETHGLMVWVLASLDTALAVAVVTSFKTLMIILSSIANHHCQPEVHTLRGALRQQHPVWEPTLVLEGL